MAELLAVNVVRELRTGHRGDTAIDKHPVRGPVPVTELGLADDRQCAPAHGGPDKALYAYALEDYAWWWTELQRRLGPGLFGENLTTLGLDVNGARIGEVWAIGDQVRIEVRGPRTPCPNLSERLGIERFHREFAASGRVGAYLKVVRVGEIAAGARIRIVRRPDHPVTVAAWCRPTAEQAEQLIGSEVDLSPEVRRRARRLTGRG
ncbi:MOSC domain-containing protein [Microlunatus sp. GCM10028923]|uniref:MOSC domain-containing protein n=1 Tax=Microlunatus sp. GCM10028923 TaxID=3273400 RepID=UPI00361C9EEE